ncbi:phage/plasmid primase, P4 family [Pseudomonas sp. OV226]|uniref:phage/plasmid primase, P4 family n=1 Tax=Pseudomonas sp. OV226 TaxID=2135588 RepID=UPI000D6D5C6F|nr:phage/plasmid primase, P4 family [Pseudomonas sp. OV226]PWK43761.1 P4 family phage/plasmid primase-like protein [Pseudomonas sp. OV226]
MNSVDLAKLKNSVSLVDLIREDVALVSAGKEYKGLCLHGEQTPSLRIYVDKIDGAERWYCHGCNKGGDHFDWRREFHGESLQEAAKALHSRAGAHSTTPSSVQAKAKEKKHKWTAVMPPPDAPPPKTIWRGRGNGHLPVISAYAYRLANGALISYACRIEVDGHKDVIPHRWSKEENKWRQKSLDTPRPLYQLHLLEGTDRVLVVEGEKACDAARKLVPDLLCVTWAGGCGAVKQTDWTPLAGKEVWLWPDCDSQRYKVTDPRAGEYLPYFEQPGAKAMAKIAEILRGLGCTVHLVKVPDPGSDWCDGFDLADALANGWSKQDVITYMDQNSAAPNDHIAEARAALALEDGPPSWMDDLPPEDDSQIHARLVECTDDYMPPALGDIAPPRQRKSRKKAPPPTDHPPFNANDAKPHEPVFISAGDMNQKYLAEWFEWKFSEVLRYCNTNKAWFEYREGHWHKDQKGHVLRQSKLVCDTYALNRPPFMNRKTYCDVEQIARTLGNFSVTAEIWDSNPLLLGTPDSTVNMNTGEIYSPRRDDYITKVTAISPGPVGSAPKLFLKFLREVTNNDPELIRYLQQFCGYCLTGMTDKHKFFFIYGPGGNGKSVFLNILQWILGDYATVAAPGTFIATQYQKHTTDLAMLMGSRLATTSETGESQKWDEDRVKRATGGELMTARFLYGQNFTYFPQFKLAFISNNKPNLTNVDAAIRRRIYIIPFLYTPATPDEGLERKLRDEGPEILRWMLDGWFDLKANGFVIPKVVADATAEYFDEQDVIAEWAGEYSELGPISGATPFMDTKKKLYASYVRHCAEVGERPKKQTAFTQALIRLGCENAWVDGVRGLKGIRLKSPDMTPDRREQPENGSD